MGPNTPFGSASLVPCVAFLVKSLLCRCADEEIGGADGMKLFVESEEFRVLNCGFALDEGITC